MDYSSMTKEELIAFINELEKKRAFTYEDQMKLIILDNSPFTLWASDRNCIIKLWLGQCESLYGYKAKEAIGKDFVELFVAKEEQLAAREDQKDIIDNGAIFHNIANDVGKNGNTLQLITNCRRIKDPESGEYWNAEMGLIIDYLEQEKDRLKTIIAESQQIKQCVTQFIKSVNQYRDSFNERITSIKSAIHECEKKAVKLRKRSAFRNDTATVKAGLDNLGQELIDIYDVHISNMQSCASSDACNGVRQAFIKEYNRLSDELEDLALDVFELSCKYDVDNNLVSEKDSLIKTLSESFRELDSYVFSVSQKIEKEISDYKDQVSNNPSPDSSLYMDLKSMQSTVDQINDDIHKDNNYIASIQNASSKDELEEMKGLFLQKLNGWKEAITEIDRQI